MSLFYSAYSGQLNNCLLLLLSQDLLSWGLNCHLQCCIMCTTKHVRPLETSCIFLMFVFYLVFQYAPSFEVNLISLHNSNYIFQRVKICCSILDCEKNWGGGKKVLLSEENLPWWQKIIIKNLSKIFSFTRCVVKQSSARASICTAAPRLGSDLWLPKNWLWQI